MEEGYGAICYISKLYLKVSSSRNIQTGTKNMYATMLIESFFVELKKTNIIWIYISKNG